MIMNNWPKVAIIVLNWNGWREGEGECYNKMLNLKFVKLGKEEKVQYGEKRTTH